MCGTKSCRQEGVVCVLSQSDCQHAAGNLALTYVLLELGTLQNCEYQSLKKFLGRGEAFVEKQFFSTKERRPHKLVGAEGEERRGISSRP